MMIGKAAVADSVEGRPGMPFTYPCACGRQLRVSESHVGRRIRCPGCGADVTVTDRPPARGPVAPAHAPRRNRGWLLLVPLLIAAVAAGWYFLRDKGPAASDASDFALVPSDAEGFFSIRVADVWAREDVRKAVDDARRRDQRTPDLALMLERDTTLVPADVERFSLVSVDLAAQLGWTIFKTRTPYSRAKILERLEGLRQESHAGQSYSLGHFDDGREVAYHFVSPTVFVASTEKGVRRFIEFRNRSRSETGPMQAILARGEEGYGIVGALRPRGAVEGLPLAGLREGELTVKFDAGATVVVTVRTGTEEDAKSLHGTLQTAQSGLAVKLRVQQFAGDKSAKQQLDLLNRLKLDQKDREVTATLTGDVAAIVAGLQTLQGTFGQ